MNLENKRITIVGGKRSGMALAKLALRLGALPKISEQGPESSLSEDFKAWAGQKKILLEFGGHTQKFIQDSDLVVLSPGVPITALPVQWAREKQIPVLGEIEFAFQFCNKPVIAVTGSNGKTTTVTVIAEILKAAGKKVCLCGNVGDPFSKHIFDLEDKDYVVLEVSSFQLEVLLDPQSQFKGFKPNISVWLNFSQNHLDRHKDLQEYFDAKKRIFLNQDKDDFAVLNFQDARLKELAGCLNPKVVFFNDPVALKNREGFNPNYLAALSVAKILGIKEEICLQVFKDFKGVEHRLEWVRSLNGVDFINDSKATTVEASRWALEQISRPIVLIAGGRDKNLDFSVINTLVQKKVRAMVVFGEAKEKLKKTFSPVVSIKEDHSLEGAVGTAKALAKAGDCVLLCPMCTSFDMFSSYEERGKVFKQIVHNLK